MTDPTPTADEIDRARAIVAGPGWRSAEWKPINERVAAAIRAAERAAWDRAVEAAAEVVKNYGECIACGIEGQPCNIPEAADAVLALKGKN